MSERKNVTLQLIGEDGEPASEPVDAVFEETKDGLRLADDLWIPATRSAVVGTFAFTVDGQRHESGRIEMPAHLLAPHDTAGFHAGDLILRWVAD